MHTCVAACIHINTYQGYCCPFFRLLSLALIAYFCCYFLLTLHSGGVVVADDNEVKKENQVKLVKSPYFCYR